MAKFQYFDLRLVNPSFDSKLIENILEFNHMKRRRVYGSTPFSVFIQIKRIFHMLESLASVRIEGNHTTISELVESRLTGTDSEERFIEIDNMQDALVFIDENIEGTKINQIFLSELHKKIVKGLSLDKEGCKSPGEYRKTKVRIANSFHLPPEPALVSSQMVNLFEFINKDDLEQYDLIKLALAHHRFAWIHPFENGNGRTVRALTYAMLVKQGFNVNQHRILNPTAVFCNDRGRYYSELANADKGTNDALIQWCEYVISGLIKEIGKIDKLLNYDYLKDEILIPAITQAKEVGKISQLDNSILKVVVKSQKVKPKEVSDLFKDKSAAARSQYLRRMIEKNILIKTETGHYTINLATKSPFMSGVIRNLTEKGFIPEELDRP